MTLDEAIEEQRLYLEHSDQWSHEKLDKAMRLGIEALRWIKYRRQHYKNPMIIRLEGETEE